jgi:hypothetical protein
MVAAIRDVQPQTVSYAGTTVIAKGASQIMRFLTDNAYSAVKLWPTVNNARVCTHALPASPIRHASCLTITPLTTALSHQMGLTSMALTVPTAAHQPIQPTIPKTIIVQATPLHQVIQLK